MLPAFLSTEDPGSALAARVAFCELFVAPHLLPSVPFADRAAWLTAGTQFPPVCAVRTLSRSQDPAPLAKAGKLGFPVLLIHGKEDVVNSPTAVVECMQALFDDLDIALLDGVGHAPVYE
jgi:pimeloyl-ACP methyl ester carboxylesterase